LQFTGRTMDEERGNGWATGVHADDLDRCVGHYLHHFRQRAPFEMEYRLRHRDGEYRWILDRGTPVFSDTGAFEGFIGSCIDVHEQHSAQDDRTLAVAQEFERWTLGIVAHDLRNPLDAIVHATGLARLRAEDPTAVRRNLDRIMPAVDRIQHIVNDLLDLTRERQGGVPIVRTDADLAVICREVIEELQGGATGRSITLTHEGDTRGHWDRNRVAQCVSNLLSNALKHGIEGTPVTVAVKSLGSSVIIEVCNEGLIPSDVMSILFLPFKPVRREGRRGGGLGLGLFIADAIARAHHGRIEVRSSELEGTCFSLWLPRNGEDSTLNRATTR
jgi:PAS domain S-box-containing protein